ncbi:efflux RND transporter periplasmic adaptor subunit [Psychroflexus sp. CAK8W]|uniref:Efflux RND transporter periplasmic adaptor subunit n=1 Tax=Psychroflexus longus TaxID=2873596 RepID=A0ABS7XGZ3_9FLAO|nr:efflux RND transporter periplasmic adaptor subunit [Psychroflexus longus]MBZ9778000.1 efflux RND transporter periplasmic adaptor subunit [Psychroflexus longus]
MKTQYKYYLGFLITFIIGIFLGITLFSSESEKEEHEHSQEQGEASVWTCSMHPQIRSDEPGDCPICGMELIPANQMEDDVDPDAIKMSKTARKLAQVETMTVGKEDQKTSMNFSGRLEINQDETRSISANFNARIERLYVNEEGEQVNRGQVIAELYAPEIQVLKEELELATRQENEVLLNSITRKIENFGLTVNDVKSLSEARLKLRAPRTGVVTNLQVKQGDNLKADQNLMGIADLSTLWAIVDVYESDLNRIKEGDELKINIPNQENVTGKVDFVSPILNSTSRSGKARVIIKNPNQNLKPGVFITAELKSSKSESTQNQALMVPKSAVLWTGKRSVVYQQLENENGVYFKMKEVETGSSSSDFIEILSGIEAGDEIVTRGAFSIDSEAQLSDKPSMMNPEGGPSSSAHNHGDMNMSNASSESKVNSSSETISEKTDVVKTLINDYAELKDALVQDDFETSKQKYKQVNSSLSKLNSNTFKGANKVKDIDELREIFIRLSEKVIAIAKTSNPTESAIYIQKCPMANQNEGATWLSFSKEIKNPYYGASMLKCGSVIDSIQ